MNRVSIVIALLAPAVSAANYGPGFRQKVVPVEGCTLSATVGGKGPTVLLLHGYAETAQMWKPLAVQLAPRFTVVAIDLPGIGDSSIPASGIDMKTSAQRIHEGVHKLGYDRARVVGHDIGLMVAYAYAAMYPSEVEQLTLMDAFLPGIGAWRDVYDAPVWHFRFYGHTPELLVKGRERTYFEHFWNDFAADGAKSVAEADRRFYTQKYAQPGAMKAGMEVFRNFDQDAKDNANFATTKLTMPVLVLGGEKSGGEFLISQGKLVATNVEGMLVLGSGHWLIDEAPRQVIPSLVEFFGR